LGCATRINQDCLSLFAEEIGLEPESRLDFSLTGAPAVIHSQASQTTGLGVCSAWTEKYPVGVEGQGGLLGIAV